MTNDRLLIRQLDSRLSPFAAFKSMQLPVHGWIHAIRTTLNMSFRQLSNKLNMSPQAVKGMEDREKTGAITLNSLQEAAQALDMQLVYGFVPKDGSLENTIERKAREIATKIVMRTSATMKLEDQENKPERIQQSIEDLTEEIKKELPKYLWD